MKKQFHVISVVTVVVFIVASVLACASSPVEDKNDSDNDFGTVYDYSIPKDQLCELVITGGIKVVRFNGDTVNWGVYNEAWYNQTKIQIPSGKHDFVVNVYFETNERINGVNETVKIIDEDGLKIAGDFSPGRSYILSPIFYDATIPFTTKPIDDFSPNGIQKYSRFSLREYISFKRKAWWEVTVKFIAIKLQIINNGVKDYSDLPDAKNRSVKTFRGGNLFVAYSPNGKQIISGSHKSSYGSHYFSEFTLWDVTTGKQIKSFSDRPEHLNILSSFVISPDGKQILSGSYKAIKLWDVATGKLIGVTNESDNYFFSLVVSQDGKQIFSGSDDKTIRIWDGKKHKLRGHSKAVKSVALSPDEKQILSGSDDKTLKLWDNTTRKVIRTFKGHTGNVCSVAFSPDGKQIISGSSDKTIKLWDTATGQEIKTFSGHKASVFSVAFSPDGKKILSGSDDKTIKLWDVMTGQVIKTFSEHSNGVHTIAFSPDGKQFISGAYDSTIKLWNVGTAEE